MEIGWFLVPYKRRLGTRRPTRYCAMDDFTTLIVADGGAWTEAECLGNHAVVKVRASAAVLTTIEADVSFQRLPTTALQTVLRDLTVGQRAALQTKVLALGYTQAEMDAQLGTGATLGNRTVADVLRFVLQRRLKPRHDVVTDTIVLDGLVETCTSLDTVDGGVT